jgi:CheY-like chemotaxis protein
MSMSGPILAVDDDPVNLMVISMMLKQMGCAYTTAKDGVEAVAAAVSARPSLVLMDISMPGLNGVEAAKAIWRDAVGARIPIVAVTANVTRRQQDECISAGFDDFLSKPLDFDSLKSVVKKCAATD